MRTHLRRPGVPYPVSPLVDPLVEEVDAQIEDHVQHTNGDEHAVSTLVCKRESGLEAMGTVAQGEVTYKEAALNGMSAIRSVPYRGSSSPCHHHDRRWPENCDALVVNSAHRSLHRLTETIPPAWTNMLYMDADTVRVPTPAELVDAHATCTGCT